MGTGHKRAEAPLKINLGSMPLLKREEEVELSKLIKKGGRIGRDARKKYIESNIRLVIKIANDYSGHGLELEDLVSEGCIGLAIAVDKFDASFGNKFSTYGSWWIRQKITRSLPEKGRLIRLPIYISQRSSNVFRFIDKFKARRGRDPTNKEIAKGLSLTVHNVEAAIKTRECGTTSLDKHFGDDIHGRTLGDTLEDVKIVNPLTACEKNDESRVINICLNKLDVREKYI